MKLKFVLVPLAVLGFAVGSYADCSKDEIKEMIKKGISSSVINSACGKKESKWITPSYTICKSNGGTVKNGVCKANWSNAKKICELKGYRLPTIDDFRNIVSSCRGVYNPKNRVSWDKNKHNTFYQNCYKEYGFQAEYYWSRTEFNNSWVWGAGLDGAHLDWFDKSNNFVVQCVYK